MNSRFRRFVLGVLAAVILSAAVPFTGFAATARIAFSDPSTQVGEEVSVTMKFTSTSGDALGNTDVMLAYDPALLEYINETDNASGGNGAIRVWSGLSGTTEVVTNLRFRALQAGTATITITSWEGYDNQGQVLTVEREGSSTVTIAGLATSSTDARLQSLQISPGTLSPSFSPSVTEYRTTVGLDTDKLTISARANNDKATVAIQGDDGLQEGENTVICTVTAEDGTTTGTYTILVTKVAGGEAMEPGDAQQPVGAEPEVLAELDVTAKKVRIIERPADVAVPEGFKESSIAIGDTRVGGWTWAGDENPRYCVFYGMNEAGEQDFYRYDLRDKTIQRYFADQQALEVTQDQYVEAVNKYNSLVDTYSRMRMILIGVAVAAVVLLILVIILLVTRRGSSYGGGYEGSDPSQGSRGRGKRLSREERYMMGHEEEYEEDEYGEEPQDDYGEEDYPEDEGFREEPGIPVEEYQPEVLDERKIYEQVSRGYGGEADHLHQQPEAARQAQARSVQEAAAAAEPVYDRTEDEEDFEIFDLDDMD